MKASLFCRIAAVLLLLSAVGHTLGFRQSDPTRRFLVRSDKDH